MTASALLARNPNPSAAELRQGLAGNLCRCGTHHRILRKQVRFDRECVTTRDWTAHPTLTFPEVPEIEVVLLDRPDDEALGAGVAAQPPTGAAIANAFAQATGRRLRDLPPSPDRVKRALS